MNAPAREEKFRQAPEQQQRKKQTKNRKRKRRSDDNGQKKNSNPLPPARQTFSCMDGSTDIAEGLVLHRSAVTVAEEESLMTFVVDQCELGRRGGLKKPTYLRASGARSQGNQRESLMYGGFFDFNRARPGKRGLVPPLPPIIKRLIDRLIDQKLLPAAVRPDSVIINRYSKGDCIPPHTDHKSYYRPISTLSLQGEESMLIGSRFRTIGNCKWETVTGIKVPLPRRSLLVLGGNSGDIAKHCISSCLGPRISITLRKQPPPEWQPDPSELAVSSPFRPGVKIDHSSHAGGTVGLVPKKKKKPLSGSAKRRKKMEKLRSMG